MKFILLILICIINIAFTLKLSSHQSLNSTEETQSTQHRLSPVDYYSSVLTPQIKTTYINK